MQAMTFSSTIFMVKQHKKIILILFLLAFLPRILALGILLQNHIDLLSTDGAGYITPIFNLLKYGVFSQSPIGTNPIPDSVRTPLYPFFLLPFLIVGAPLAVVAVVQDMLFAIAVVFVYLMGQKIFHEKTARVAAILMALEPFGVISTNFIMPQNIYYPFFIPAIFLILYYLQAENSTPLYWSSVLLGISALIKPVVIALFPFIFVGVVLKHTPWQTKIRTCLFVFIIFFLVVSPWLIRNKINIGTWQFSSISDVNLYASNALLFKDFFNIQDSPIIEDRFSAPSPDTIANPVTTQAAGEAARAFIKKHLGKYVVFHLLYTPRLFIIDQYLDLVQIFYQKPLLPIMPNLYSEFMHGNIAALNADFFTLIRNPIFLISFAGKLIWIGFAFLLLRSLFVVLRFEQHYDKKSIIIFSFLFLCWYALVFSPVGRAGYRIPINFLIFLIGLEYFFFPLSKRDPAIP